MKSIAAEDSKGNLESLLDSAQAERVVITRGGKPSAVLVGVESYDAEDLALAQDPDFWKMIEERRSGPSVPLAEVKARLGQAG